MDIQSVPGLPLLHAETLGDNRVCIAVLDGPEDLSHPCFHGADLRRLDTLVPDAAGNGPMSLHGTHIASLLFGQPGSPITGIAPRCRGLIVPVFRDNREGRLSQLDLARTIEQAVAEGAHIINVSGGQRSPTAEADSMLERALTLCKSNNVLVVAATGNDGCECLHVPAAVSSVLAVGAIGLDREPLEISNWGQAYRSNGALAPGQDIEGAAPGGGTASMTGSSFSTPVVSGVAALLLSLQAGLGQPLDAMAARQAILRSAVPCEPRASPACRRYLTGTLNIARALTSIKEGVETTVTNPDAADTLIPPVDVDRTESDMSTSEPAMADAGRSAGCTPPHPPCPGHDRGREEFLLSHGVLKPRCCYGCGSKTTIRSTCGHDGPVTAAPLQDTKIRGNLGFDGRGAAVCVTRSDYRIQLLGRFDISRGDSSISLAQVVSG